MSKNEEAVEKNVKAAISSCKSDGITGMSLMNLRQITKTAGVSGLAPGGYYALFETVAKRVAASMRFPLLQD